MVTELSKDNFKDVTGKGKVVVDFWAPWCGPCRMFAPVFEEAAKEHKDITFGKLNTESHHDVAIEHGIRAIPTLMFFKDGEVVEKKPGALTKEQFEEKLKDVFS